MHIDTFINNMASWTLLEASAFFTRTIKHSLSAQKLLTILVVALSIASTKSDNVDSTSEGILQSFPKASKISYPWLLSGQGAVKNAAESDTILSVEIINDIFTTAIKNFQFSERSYDMVHALNRYSEADIQPLETTIVSILDSLSNGSAVTDNCVNDTGYLLINILQAKGWALKFIDTAGKIGPGLSEFRVNWVGEYDMCRSLIAPPSGLNDSYESKGFRGSYSTLKASLGGPPDPNNPYGALLIQWGVCMPSSCTAAENTEFLSEIVSEAAQLIPALNNTLYVVQAEIHSDHTEVTTATALAVLVICVFSCLMIMGTAYDVLFLQWPIWRAEWAKTHGSLNMDINTEETDVNGTLPNGIHDDDPLLGKDDPPSPPPPPGKLVQALLAFSVYTNGSKVLNTYQSPSSITCINGIRFLSLTWVMLGHLFAFGLSSEDNSASELPVMFHRWSFDVVSNAFLSVDTFFTISGVLIAYLTVKDMQKKGLKLNWGLFYFHRYWRLTPPYMLTVLIALGLHQYCGSGPLWENVQPPDREQCEKYWWTNMLYINNFMESSNTCFPHSWYLSNDMQFYIVAPLMIIPFYFHAGLGFIACGAFLLTTWITTGVLSTANEWPDSIILAASTGQLGSYFEDYYEAPWCRIGPYVVGIMTGYILATKRNQIRLSWPIATIGWILATATALAALYGLRGDLSGDHISSVTVAAFYNSFARTAWGASICWLIIACVTGWGGFVNTLLSWSPFVVLGRLTYMAYLVHFNMIYIYFQNQQTLLHLTSLNMAMIFMGIMVSSYAVAFVFMMAFESPMIGLEKVFLPKRRS